MKKKRPLTPKQEFHSQREFILKGQLGSIYVNLRRIAESKYLTHLERQLLETPLTNLHVMFMYFDFNSKLLKKRLYEELYEPLGW